jgi:hypothetical protein
MVRIQKSSTVAGAGYDAKSRTMYIEFLRGYKPRNGRMQKKKLRPGETVLYKYLNVDRSVYYQLLYAPSKGRFVWRRIRGRRKGMKGSPYDYRADHPKYRYMRLGRKGWRGPVGGHAAKNTKSKAFKSK